MKRIIKLSLYVLITPVLVYIHYFESPLHDFIEKYAISRSIITFLIFYAIVNSSALLLKWSYSKRHKIDLEQKNNVHYGIENIAKLIIGIGLTTTALAAFGIQLWEVIASITIIATAIAIITKEYIADFLVGIHLSFSNMFEVGDFVKVGDKKGEVLGVNMLKTLIRNEDDDIVMLPHTSVHYNEIVNFTKKNIRQMSVDFQLEKNYIQGAEELKERIIKKLKHLDKHIDSDSYELQVVNVKSGYFDFKFNYTLKKVSMDIHRKARKVIIHEVYLFILETDKNQVRLSVGKE